MTWFYHWSKPEGEGGRFPIACLESGEDCSQHLDVCQLEAGPPGSNLDNM